MQGRDVVIAAGLFVGALLGLSVCVAKREQRRWRDARSITARFYTPPTRWWTEDSDGNIEWHDFPRRERAPMTATCPACGHEGPLGTDDRPCEHEWHLEHGSLLEREVAQFMAAQRRTNETLAAPTPCTPERPCPSKNELHVLLFGECYHEPEVEQIASLTGVPEGVGPNVRPDCPICTGGRGLPCAWHSLS